MKHPIRKAHLHVGKLTLRYFEFTDFNKTVSEAIEGLTPDDQVPLYGTVWPAAICLLQYLDSLTLDWPNIKVLELGCGLALPSIYCVSKGAQAIASDYHQGAEPFIRKNAALNNCDVEFVTLDWRQPSPPLEANLVIASDILYEPQIYPALAKFLDTLKHTNPQAHLIIADPKRIMTQSFVEELRQTGFVPEILDFGENVIFKVAPPSK